MKGWLLILDLRELRSSLPTGRELTLGGEGEEKKLYQMRQIRRIDDGLVAFFASSDADCIVNGIDKDFSITDMAGSADCFGGFNHFFDRDFTDHNFNFHFWHQINGILRSSVNFPMSFL